MPSSPADWMQAFPALGALRDPAGRAVLEAARGLSAAAGTVLFREGEPCANYLLLLRGSVRVHKVAESGREIVLYRVEAGEACVLTTACLMAHEHYPAEGIAETDVDAVVIPMDRFQRGLAESEGFRAFVFQAYSRRLSDLIALVQDVAFGRVEARLADTLLERADAHATVRATHQELATELGTAREVVSRQLKEFERKGWVRLGRGSVQVLVADALRSLSRPAGLV